MRVVTIDDFCRIFSKITVDDDTGCWIIAGSDNGKGYKRVWIDEKNRLFAIIEAKR